MRIKLLNKITDTGINQFDPIAYEFSEDFDTYDAIMVHSAKLHDMESPVDLKCIARAGAGVNNIPLDRYSEQGVIIFNTPGANASAVRELIMARLLMSSHKITKGIEWVKTLEGDDISKAVEEGESSFVSPGITGRKLGIIGLGTIGVLVVSAAAAMDMEVPGHDPFISVKAAWILKAKVHRIQNLKQISEKCDYITIHVPFNDKIANIIDAETITAMKGDVRVLNFIRGGLTDGEAMMKAMDEGKITVCVMDLPTEELLQYGQMIGVPHLGALTPESGENRVATAANEIMGYLETGDITHSVNFPDMQLVQEYKYRTYIINKSMPNVVGTITTALANVDMNIENMIDKGRRDYAYTIFDTNDEVSEELMERLCSRRGIVNMHLVTAKAQCNEKHLNETNSKA